eukprot:GFUD01034958.1.p1 GENE.GFUD01034958.1~~GFUD01034958.1.p1  ORF type:complete len:499 (-),score=162.75 GFUD01034958.1:97-1563(-)
MPPQVPPYTTTNTTNTTNTTYPATKVKTFSSIHYGTSFPRSVSILKPQPKLTTKDNSITVPRSQKFSTVAEAQKKDALSLDEHSTNNDDTNAKDDEISVIPGPNYQVQEGILKRVFLEKMDETEFFVQLVMGQDLTHARRVLIISDSRDSTANYTIQDNSVVALVKKNIFPVIRVTEWAVADQTININKFAIVDKVKTTLGNPKPIQKSFFNYLKNLLKREKTVTDTKLRVPCKTCKGCLKKACRVGGTGKTPCTKCKLNDQDNCLRRKCVRWLELKETESPASVANPASSAPSVTENPASSAPSVTDINLLPEHHPLRVRCEQCNNCNTRPCRNMKKLCTKCKAMDRKRCLKRVCVDWTRYSITSSDIKEIEEQQARIFDMMNNPPSKVLLLHKSTANDPMPQQYTVSEQHSVSVKKEKLEELDITENKIVVDKENQLENIEQTEDSYDFKTDVKCEAEEDDDTDIERALLIAEEDDDTESTLFIAC